MIKPKIPPDFAEVARGKRTAELAVLYGVSPPTIRVWCKEVGVTPGRLPRGKKHKGRDDIAVDSPERRQMCLNCNVPLKYCNGHCARVLELP